jgi:hypothetical protein
VAIVCRFSLHATVWFPPPLTATHPGPDPVLRGERQTVGRVGGLAAAGCGGGGQTIYTERESADNFPVFLSSSSLGRQKHKHGLLSIINILWVRKSRGLNEGGPNVKAAIKQTLEVSQESTLSRAQGRGSERRL